MIATKMMMIMMIMMVDGDDGSSDDNCYGLHVCVSLTPNSYDESLTPKVKVLVGGALGGD